MSASVRYSKSGNGMRLVAALDISYLNFDIVP